MWASEEDPLTDLEQIKRIGRETIPIIKQQFAAGGAAGNYSGPSKPLFSLQEVACGPGIGL
jgi:hypothetical protein